MVASLTATAAGLVGVGNAAQAAGAGVAAGTNAMGTNLGAANTQASSLMTTLKGMGQLYAALKIEKGLKESATEAINYQATQARMATMGMTPAEQAEMVHAADAASKAVAPVKPDENQ